MCGIVGYLGDRDADDVLLAGLRRLEYRGYDSAGLVTVNGDGFDLRRAVGRVERLKDLCEEQPVRGSLGVAHTRWATHGRPSVENAHPHVDAAGKVVLVHNGVIENHAAIRDFLKKQDVTFRSETDTEVLAQLVGFFYAQTGDLLESVRRGLHEVRGTFGIAVVSPDAPHTLIAARRGSPLLVGQSDGAFFIASDASAIAGQATRVTYLDDDEVVRLGPDGMTAGTIDDVPVTKQFEALELAIEDVELDHTGFEHHMLKEIYEQPESLLNTLRGRVREGSDAVKLGGLAQIARELPRTERLLLMGCGTAWHAGLIGEYLFEELAGIPCEVEYASELRYRNPIVLKNTLAVAVSQSGETADTLAALREVQTRGARVLGVVNTVGSTIARETDAGVYLHVGPEIGVASTKAFTSQVAVLAMMALDLGRRRHLSPERTIHLAEELLAIPDKIAAALELNDEVAALAGKLVDRDNWLYLGRGVNFPAALEGALKLKEISYIHAEGLPAAEMKHGPIALIDDGMPVVVIAPHDHTYEKVLSNIEEVKSRKGRVIAVVTEGDTEVARIADECLYVPRTEPILSPLVTSIPLQLLAYHCAVLRGLDVDKPRNLAKSVTVE